MPDLDIMDAIDLGSVAEDLPDDPGDPTAPPPDAADQPTPEAEETAPDEDAAPETADGEEQPTTSDWQTHPAVQAWLQEEKRKDRAAFKANVTDLLRRALDGDGEAIKKLSSDERKMYRLVRDLTVRDAAEIAKRMGPNGFDPYQEQWTRHERIDSLRRTNPYAFEEWRNQPENADEVAWYEGDMVTYKTKTLGLKPNATTVQMRERLDRLALEAREQQASTATAGVDPDATYDEFTQSATWAHLTDEEKASVDPDNFADRQPHAAVKAMERIMGRLEARVETRQAQAEAPPKATTKDGVKAAMAKAPPIIGGTPPSVRNFDQLEQQWIDAMQEGRMTPQLERDYHAAVAKRENRTAAWI